jgi:hypothetical protein
MIETNIRIVYPGNKLFVWVRRATITSTSSDPELQEKACNKLRRKYGIAAIRYPGDPTSLLVASSQPIKPIHMEDESWEFDVVDVGEESRRIEFHNQFGAETIPALIERSLLATLSQRDDFWTLDSPRIFYESKPFLIKDGISVFRRFEISALPIEGVGVGIAVDVGTAFFTTESVAYFFDQKLGDNEKKRREEAFAQYTGRQIGQKGTLLYDNGVSRVKCYFEKVTPGETCSTTGVLRVSNQRYSSLLEYYRETNPSLPVDENTPVVRVSFPGLDKGTPVAADRVRIRIMNDDVPETISNVDKLNPSERKRLLDAFWGKIGPTPFKGIAPRLQTGFWRPNSTHVEQYPIPSLVFGQGEILEAPKTFSPDSYRHNYHQRMKYLEDHGCYSISPTMNRTLYCVFPIGIDEKARQQLTVDIAERISKWTKANLSAEIVTYQTVHDAVDSLRGKDNAGVALFILDNEPVAYYDAAFMLPGWRIKRITDQTLKQQYDYLTRGKFDRKINSHSLDRGKKQWESFITMNSLALLSILEAVPFKTNTLGNYDAQLAIDVGHDRRFSALSLTIVRNEEENPPFLSRSDVSNKPDTQHEMINPVLLSDQVVALFDAVFRKSYKPVRSMLIMRDGYMSEKELTGIMGAITILKNKDYMSPDSRVDIVDLRKDTMKSLRLWEVDEKGEISNPLEGTAVHLNQETIVLATTGSSTLHQGTAEPIVLKSNGNCPDLAAAAKSVFSGAQLNWFSPSVAQRLPLALKITDDELTARSVQEVRRLR